MSMNRRMRRLKKIESNRIKNTRPILKWFKKNWIHTIIVVLTATTLLYQHCSYRVSIRELNERVRPELKVNNVEIITNEDASNDTVLVIETGKVTISNYSQYSCTIDNIAVEYVPYMRMENRPNYIIPCRKKITIPKIKLDMNSSNFINFHNHVIDCDFKSYDRLRIYISFDIIDINGGSRRGGHVVQLRKRGHNEWSVIVFDIERNQF